MKFILFSNLRNTPRLKLDGSEVDCASRVRKIPRLKHLGYSPDFFKYCESVYDAAVFYVGKPLSDTSGRQLRYPPMCVWQALGYWMARRRITTDDSTRRINDSIVFVEGGEVSNLDGFVSVYKITVDWDRKSARDDWQQILTTKILEFAAFPDSKSKDTRIPRLIEKLQVDSTEIKFSGYSQAKRPCDLRHRSFELLEAGRDSLLISHSLSRLLATVNLLRSQVGSAAPHSSGHLVAPDLSRDLPEFRRSLETIEQCIRSHSSNQSVDPIELLVSLAVGYLARQKQRHSATLKNLFTGGVAFSDNGCITATLRNEVTDALSCLENGIDRCANVSFVRADLLRISSSSSDSVHQSFCRVVDTFLQNPIL